MLPLTRGEGETIIIDTPSDSAVFPKHPRSELPQGKAGMESTSSVIIHRELLLTEK